MSHPTTLSQPPEPLTSTPSRVPPPLSPEVQAALTETIRRLRAELFATNDAGRQARLLTEMGEAQERAGEEPAATRDYLAAYSADATFHEPLEGLVRVLEKRRSLRNLGRLVDALVSTATAADERVRALLMRASYLADVAANPAEAEGVARDATAVEGAPPTERASAWLALEVLAGRTGDAIVRDEALGERVKHATDPTWRALLLLDRARMRAAIGESDAARTLAQEALSFESSATWAATTFLETLVREQPGAFEPDARTRELHATTLEALARLVEEAIADGARGDALGVPHWMRRTARRVDAWLRAAEARRLIGQLDRAAGALDRALSIVDGAATATVVDPAARHEEERLAGAALSDARIRVAQQAGDTELAGRIAEGRLKTETDPGLAAALAMRMAAHAAAKGDGARALEALSKALACDPGCLPARALQLDMLADGDDPAAYAAQLEAFADHLETDEARGRAFLLAAYVWSVRARDTSGAKAALSQAAMFGVSPATTGRLARSLASIAGEPAWYEEATKRLLAAGGTEAESVSLYIELVRLRYSRGDADGAARALREMGGTPRGAWLARVLEAFGRPATTAPNDGANRALTAVEELATLETDPDLSRGLSLVAAMRAHADGNIASARAKLRELADRDAADPIVASYLGDLDRAAGDHAAAARVASDAAAATTDVELAAAFRLEAGFERWRDGDRVTAIEEMEAAATGAPEAAKTALAWASWGVDPNSLDARRMAIQKAMLAGEEGRALAIERFAVEIGAGDDTGARAALAEIEEKPDGSLGVAAAIGRLAWTPASSDETALTGAMTRIDACGPGARLLTAVERVRFARAAHDREALARETRGWFEAGGGLPAALEWLAAAADLGEPREERAARLAVAASLSGDGRDAMLASAALVGARIDPSTSVPFVAGPSASVRLTNLDLAPPGCDPRRRGTALEDINGLLGGSDAIDAIALSGWSFLVASDVEAARAAFESATAARPTDLGAWEGLRTCGERSGDKALRMRAAVELGGRCQNAPRAAAFWEEAALLGLELADDAGAERALEASFAHDPSRPVAFDKLFRRVRARKDNERLLALITRRLDFTDDPAEIQKLFWEQARVLREGGDHDAALKALEHVTMLDPDHVGALALLGEINIRRAQFDDAATALARLAKLEAAPAKSRVTAGIAAVDLYENKLGRFDSALEVLLALHHAKLSTLRVRERLARAAARTGSWTEATAILQELMHERPETEGRIEAARLAMAIHRDRLGTPQDAAPAIVKLLEEEPGDGEALDMLLQTAHAGDVRERLLAGARTALVASLQRRPMDPPAVRRLVKVARALKDEAMQQAALGALASMGAADSAAEQAFAQLAAKKGRTPQVAVSQSMLRTMLAPGDEGPIADLFVLLGPTIAEALGPSLAACGVGRRDKIDPRSGLALRNEIASWAGAFGIHAFDLYVGGKEPLDVQGVPGEPPALIVGPSIKAPLSPMVRARIARELVAMVRGTVVARSRDDVTIAAIVVAACDLAEVPIEHPPYAVLTEVERLIGKAISRKTRKALAETCRAIVASHLDARTWAKRTLASHDRIAVIASGDPGIVLCDTLGVPLERLGQATQGNPRAEELLRFVLSPQYLDLRRSLGLES